MLVQKFNIKTKILVSDAQIQTLKGHFTPGDVHKQCAISFISPPYPDQKIVEDVNVSKTYKIKIINLSFLKPAKLKTLYHGYRIQGQTLLKSNVAP